MIVATSTNGLKNLPLLKNVNLNDNPSLESIDEIGQIASLEIVTPRMSKY